MTKGLLICECIKLLYGNDEKLDSSCISSNDDYAEYTNNIIGSINRALQRIQDFDKIPYNIFIIDNNTAVSRTFNSYNVYNMSELVSDYGSLRAVELYDNYYTNKKISVKSLGYGNLMLAPLNGEESYIVKYKPQISLITEEMEDSQELPYPNIIYQYIPYFVKADRYEEDNANVANLNRNIFEEYARSIEINNDDNENFFENVYTFNED